jgi:tetratricopeptide (TPR) repeat protein
MIGQTRAGGKWCARLWLKAWGPPALLALTIGLLYAPFLNNPPVMDSAKDFIPEKIGAFHWQFYPRILPHFLFHLTYRVVGLAVFWHQFINVALHIMSAIALYVFLRQLFARLGNNANPTTASDPVRSAAFFAALTFGLHPMNVYAVNYLTQRNIVMAALFGWLMLICVLRYLDGYRRLWLVASVGFYALSIFSKEHSASLPVAMVLLVLLSGRLFTRRVFFDVTVTCLAYAALVFSLYMTHFYTPQIPFETLAKVRFTQDIASQFSEGMAPDNSLLLSILKQCGLFFRYVGLWLAPLPRYLALDLPLPFPKRALSGEGIVGGTAFAAYVLAAGWLLWRRDSRRLIGFGLMTIAALFVVEFSVVRYHEQFVPYRVYVWFGFLGIPWIWLAMWAGRWRLRLFRGLAVYAVLLAALAHGRLTSLTSALSAWQDAAEKINQSDLQLHTAYRPFLNYATALAMAGQREQALVHYRLALKFNRGLGSAYTGMGSVYAVQGHYDEAIALFRQAMTLSPDPNTQNDGYYNIGSTYEKMGRIDDAIAAFVKALEAYPEDMATRGRLAAIYREKGNVALIAQKTDDAKKYYAQSLLYEARQAPILNNLGVIALGEGDKESARRYFRAALVIQPDYAQSLKGLEQLQDGGR